MKRFDLRHLGVSFEGRMCEIIEQNLAQGEVGIFIFEIGDFSGVKKSANLIAQKGWTLMNSLRFNEVDWTIVVKKATPSLRDDSHESVKRLCEAPTHTCKSTNQIDCHDSAQGAESRNDDISKGTSNV